MCKALVLALLLMWASIGLCFEGIQDPGPLPKTAELPPGKALPTYRNPPAYTFSRTPITLLNSYYDYMIGSYNSLPLRVVPNSAGGGYFMTYHGRRTVTGLRRVFYNYLDSNGSIINNVELSPFPIHEGYPTLAVDPVSGKPMYAWHADVDNDSKYEVLFTSDAFIAGLAGLFNEEEVIVDNPITITAPDGTITTDNEFIWPSAVIGPSPIMGKHRVYVLSRNLQSQAYGPSENVYIRFADYTAADIENGIPLLWNTDHFTIPELDQWNVDDIWRRASGSLACDSMGNLYYCGYHFAYDSTSQTNITEAELDVFKCPNYGEGTWSRISAFSNLPSWNPPATPNSSAGYFTNSSGIPYADNELQWVIMNSGHLNATVDSENRIHVPALWGLRNSDGVYYKDLQVVKEYVYDPSASAAQQFRINDVYPSNDFANPYDENYQPWDIEAPWGEVDGWDIDEAGEYVPQMATIWPFGHWDSTAHNDAMMFHYNNIKITEANDQGMMAMVWLDSQKAKWYNADNDSTYVAYAQSPEIYISVSPSNGGFWSEPIVLNSINTPELSGLRPQWVYPADKVIFMGYNNYEQIVAKLGLMFYSDNDWFCNSIPPPTHCTNPGGQVKFMELQITFPGPDYGNSVFPPILSHASGYYPTPIDVSIYDSFGGAEIHYTTDGSMPDTGAPVYSSPVHIAQSCTLKAKAYHPYLDPSATVSRAYQIAVANPDDTDTPLVTGISQLYPNPFSKQLNIQLGFKEANQDYQLKIYNLKGECVYQAKGIGTGKLDLNWDGKSSEGNRLPKGIYLLSFKCGNIKQTRKLTLL